MNFHQLVTICESINPKESEKPPRGYKVTVRKIKIPSGFDGDAYMYDCMVWHDHHIILSTSGTMFDYTEQARECGNQRAWDIFHNRGEWT